VKIQIEKTNEYEKRRQSVETLRQVRTKEFILSLSNVESTIKKGGIYFLSDINIRQ